MTYVQTKTAADELSFNSSRPGILQLIILSGQERVQQNKSRKVTTNSNSFIFIKM